MFSGRILASPNTDMGVRGFVAAPTDRHIPYALAAVSASKAPDRATTVDDTGNDVATVMRGKLTDSRLTKLGERLNLGGVQFNQTAPKIPPVAPLPQGWDIERSQHSEIPTEAESLCGEIGWEDKSVPWQRTYFNQCRSPILVIAPRIEEGIADALELGRRAEWWRPLQMLTLLDPGRGLSEWYRRPLIIATSRSIEDSPWCSQLPVSMVIANGFKAWASPARLAWPTAPHILVLSQRHQEDMVDFRNTYDGVELAELASKNSKSMRNRQQGGFTFTIFGEPLAGSDASDYDDEEF